MIRLFVLAVLFIPCWSISSHAVDLDGVGDSVVDGDEFILCKDGKCLNIRLCGIDTPSKGAEGHAAAIDALGKLVLGEQVLCRPVGEGSVCDGLIPADSRGRTVAQCFANGGTVDVAAQLVNGGFACDREKRSGGSYSKDHPDRKCRR
jgi:endonuclease YncB( thermonuclease family)